MSERPLAIITGAAAGLGLETSKGLLRRGCDVVLTDRNVAAGQAAQRQLAAQFPDAEVSFQELDLADLSRIALFAANWLAEGRVVDILINNAGLYPPNRRATTAQGFELGFGVSFYGHFALTAPLLPALLASPAARVVCVSSIAHVSGHIDLDDPKLERHYDCNRAYSACKLACLILAREMNRRALKHGAPLRAFAAHPGIARTQIGQHEDNPATTLRQWLIARATAFAMRFLGQEADAGARPMVYAALEPGLQGGEFLGPDGFQQFRGAPGIVKASSKTLSRHDAAAVWTMAEQQTGQNFDWKHQNLT